MITKWIEFRVAVEAADSFSSELAKMQTASQTEAGCAHYSVYRGAGDGDDNLFTVLESWETADHLEAHRKSDHMAAFKENCTAMITEKRAVDLQAAGG
jgi:quinol monooxygenase YgiN